MNVRRIQTKILENETYLFLHQFFQKSHVFVESSDIFQILMMKGFSFFWDKYDIIASCCTDVCDRIEEATTKEIARYRSFRMFS